MSDLHAAGGGATAAPLPDTGTGEDPPGRDLARAAGDPLPGGAPSSTAADAPAATLSKEAARAKLDRLYAEAGKDPKHPLSDREHPDYRDMQREVLALYARAHPDDDRKAATAGPTPVAAAEARELLLQQAQIGEADDLDVHRQGLDVAATWFASAGIGEGEARELIQAYNEAPALDGELSEPAIVARQEATIATLRSTWGDGYDAKLAGAFRAAQKIGGQQLLDFLDTSRLGDDPRVILAFARVAERNNW